MKSKVARIFCFVTVLLLCSNVALFSALSGSNINFHKDSVSKYKKENSINDGFDNSGSALNLLSEKEQFEEYEFIKDQPGSYKLYIKEWFRVIPVVSLYKPYFSAHLKVPQWLWVRHIII